jgi:large repetitive protein
VLLAVAVLAGVFAATAAALRFSDASYFTPEGVVGVPYGHRFEGVGGSPPYDIHVIRGSLPPGLTMNSAGQVSGTPTASGSWSFWVELADTWCPSHDSTPCAQREFTINVIPGLQIQQPSLPIARPGVGYQVQLTASGGGTQNWALVGGALPAGITLSGTGLISGVSTAVGVYTVSVAVSDDKRSDRKDYRLVVTDPLVLAGVVPASLEVGIEFASPDPSLSGGVPPYVWAVQDGTLPPGLELDPAAGVIKGTPGRAGDYPVKFTVTDAAGAAVSADAQFTVARKLKVKTRRLPNGKVGKPVADLLETRGGVMPLDWEIVEGTLPRGLRLAPTTGGVVGRPKQGGKFRFSVEATDALGATHTRSVFMLVKKMTIATRRLPNAKVGRIYRSRLATRKGETPVRWRIVRGKLPKGLRLAKRTGAVVGRPKQTGVFRPTLRAVDRYGDVATRRVVLVVRSG